MIDIKQDFLKDFLKYQMSDAIQCMMANEYLGMHNERNIFVNDEDGLETMLETTEKSEIVRAICFGKYNFNDNFVKINDHGNIESLDDVWDCVNINNMIDWLIYGNVDDLDDAYMIMKDDEIADILNNFVECFADNLNYDYNDVAEWVYLTNIGVIDICRADWNDLHEEFFYWNNQKKKNS